MYEWIMIFMDWTMVIAVGGKRSGMSLDVHCMD